MKYISDQDYEYISNKFHDTRAPFDPFKRFVRHDAIFSPLTGMDGDAIVAEISHRDLDNTTLPHPIRKARAFAFVLENTRIACDPRDRFPAINTLDRPLNQALINLWKKEVFEEILPEVGAKRKYLETNGIVTIWPDFDHSVPDWDRILSLGFTGLLEESEKARKSRPRTVEEDAFFEGIRITYRAIIAFVGRLASLAEETKGSERMAAALRALELGAPRSFYEALLLNYLYFIICEHIEGLQVRSLSNFDRLFFPFCESDLQRGVSEESIRTDLAYFLLQFTAIGNYWNQPVYLGGCKADESTEINALSYLFLDVYDRMRIFNPKIQLKIADSTPKDFIEKALDMIRRGNSSIVFVSDATIRNALVRAGADPADARMCNVTGCYEYSIISAYGTGMNYLNLLKPLEYALHEGKDGVTGHFSGCTSPAPESYTTFDALYAEYKHQLLALIDSTVDVTNAFEDYLSYINPQSMLSATFSSCLESGRDAIHGGAKENSTTMEFGFIADLVDSLTMIQKYVYDEGLLSLPELIAILDNSFEGNELLRLKLWNDREKYGNNKDRPDAFAVDIVSFITEKLCGRPNAKERSGTWTCAFHVARQSYTQGAKTAASANGRILGEELSKNLSASMGQNREGATAAILSVTKIDATAFRGDASLDLGLLPSAVRGEDGLSAMYALLMTFIKRGGHAIHFNVFDAKTLRDAQKHPERYADLQIRVCGWNVLWNNINKAEQDGFIRQAESLIP